MTKNKRDLKKNRKKLKQKILTKQEYLNEINKKKNGFEFITQ